MLGGYTEFGVVAGDKDTITNGGHDRSYTFFMDNEVFISANGATESGILYGSHIELEVASGGIAAGRQQQPDATVDEAGLYFSGNFGRVELGREDGAEDVMYVGGEDAQAGTGGIDGDIPNINFVQFNDTGNSAKATYFTPRLAGFQLGVSFTPDYEDNGGENQFQGDSAEGENGLGGGINWVGALGALDLTLSAVGIWADCESNCDAGGGLGTGSRTSRNHGRSAACSASAASPLAPATTTRTTSRRAPTATTSSTSASSMASAPPTSASAGPSTSTTRTSTTATSSWCPATSASCRASR